MTAETPVVFTRFHCGARKCILEWFLKIPCAKLVAFFFVVEFSFPLVYLSFSEPGKYAIPVVVEGMSEDESEFKAFLNVKTEREAQTAFGLAARHIKKVEDAEAEAK